MFSGPNGVYNQRRPCDKPSHGNILGDWPKRKRLNCLRLHANAAKPSHSIPRMLSLPLGYRRGRTDCRHEPTTSTRMVLGMIA
jgi:hypothetical protein